MQVEGEMGMGNTHTQGHYQYSWSYIIIHRAATDALIMLYLLACVVFWLVYTSLTCRDRELQEGKIRNLRCFGITFSLKRCIGV